MSPTLTVKADYEVTPHEVAQWFWEMNEEDQAKFFAHLAIIDGNNSFAFESQMLAVRKHLTPEAKQTIENMCSDLLRTTKEK